MHGSGKVGPPDSAGGYPTGMETERDTAATGGSSRRALFAILAAGLVVRLALTPLYAHLPDGLLDEGFWKHWMQRIQEHGVLNIFRTSDTDYVGYHWVLWMLSIVYGWIGGPYTQTTPSLHILVKMPSIAFDLVLITAVYLVAVVVGHNERVPRDRSKRLAIIAACVCAFQPAILYDSAVWAQTDAAISAAMLGSLALAFRGRPIWSGVVFALGFAIKPHPIIILPLLAITLLRNGGPKALAQGASAAIAMLLAILAPWLLHGDGYRIARVYETLFTKERDRLSELAWNVWWIPDQAGDPRPRSAVIAALDPLTYERLALGLSVCATLLAVAFVLRHKDFASTLIAASYQAFAFFELPIGSHERYLYPFLVFLLPVVMVRPKWWLLYAPVSTGFFLNLVIVAPPMKRFMDDYVYGDVGIFVAATNTLLFAIFTGVLLATCLGRQRAKDGDPSLRLAV